MELTGGYRSKAIRDNESRRGRSRAREVCRKIIGSALPSGLRGGKNETLSFGYR